MAQQQSRSSSPAALAKRVVLVVEDNPIANGRIARLLQDAGYQAVQAFDGEEGLSAASRVHPDAVIMDIMLPKLDGWHVLDALKRNPDLHNIPVIISSMTDHPQLGRSLGAVAFLPKPLDAEVLLVKLRELLPQSAS